MGALEGLSGGAYFLGEVAGPFLAIFAVAAAWFALVLAVTSLLMPGEHLWRDVWGGIAALLGPAPGGDTYDAHDTDDPTDTDDAPRHPG